MTLSRREMLKAQAAGVAALAANMSVPAEAQPVAGGVDSLQIKWSKAPCRFCGTGCGVMVGVKEGKVIATHGDIKADVNRGLNCIKGYFLSKIMYGNDRLTQPLLRKRNGVYAQDGEFGFGRLGQIGCAAGSHGDPSTNDFVQHAPAGREGQAQKRGAAPNRGAAPFPVNWYGCRRRRSGAGNRASHDAGVRALHRSSTVSACGSSRSARPAGR